MVILEFESTFGISLVYKITEFFISDFNV